MAEIATPDDVRLICGMISADVALLPQAADAMGKVFSTVDIVSDVMNFDFTTYYDDQMGRPLYRQFVSFSKVVAPDILAPAKRMTNALERDFAARGGGATKAPRPINLDVGYVDQAKLVLASMKDFSHRIYLSGGVYAEVTLMYRKGTWEPLAWTFPDYASGRYSPFLSTVRKALREDLQTAAEVAPPDQEDRP